MSISRWSLASHVLLSSAFLLGCGSMAGPQNASKANVDPKKDPAPGFLISIDAFKAVPKVSVKESAAVQTKSENSSPVPFIAKVLLYSSPSTQSYLESGGVDASYRIQAWDSVLVKYKIPFQQINRVAQIDNGLGGVLLLPSSVALSRAERQAIVDFRSRGGSVLATWAAGIRDEHGSWQGFDFMAQELDTKIVGTTAADKTDNFLMVQGNSPVNQIIPAGHRVWTERVSEWLPLRMQVKNPSLHIMDWSRTFADKKTTAVAHYDERMYANGTSSRVIAFGLAERLWLTADPRYIEAIAHNSIHWLLRLPSASASAWPDLYRSALLFALDCAELILDADLATINALQDAGVRATLYVLGDNAKRSAAKLSNIAKAGHELGFKGDKFSPFSGQSADVQAQRIDSGLEKIKQAGLALPDRPSFHAPTESYDKTTEAIVRQRGFGHHISFQDASEARLPVVVAVDPTAAVGSKPFVAFPRSQRGPEDATEEGDVEDGLKSFYAEFALAVQMRGLAVVRMPNQGLLPIENIQEISDELKRYRSKVWMATAGQIADWWIERERVEAKVIGTTSNPVLKVSVSGSTALTKRVTILINMPLHKGSVQLLRDGKPDTSFRIDRIDEFQIAVQLPELTSGSHEWQLKFL